MSCNRHYGIVGYPDCSGHGTCVEGLCVCFEDWSSIGAFQLQQGYDCDIHLPTLKYFTISGLIISTPGLFYILYELTHVLKAKSYTFRHISIISGVFWPVCSVLYMILNLYDRETYTFGKSLLLAIANSFMPAGAFGVASLYFIQLMHFLEGYTKILGESVRNRMQILIDRWRIVMMAAPFCLFFSFAAIQFYGLYVKDQDRHSDTVAMVISLLAAFMFMTYFWFLNSILRMFIKELEAFDSSSRALSDANDNSINRILKNSKFIYQLLSCNVVMPILLYSTDTVWHFFRRKASYSLIAHMTMVNVTIPFYFYALYPQKFEPQKNKKWKIMDNLFLVMSTKISGASSKALVLSSKLSKHSIVPIYSTNSAKILPAITPIHSNRTNRPQLPKPDSQKRVEAPIVVIDIENTNEVNMIDNLYVH